MSGAVFPGRDEAFVGAAVGVTEVGDSKCPVVEDSDVGTVAVEERFDLTKISHTFKAGF